MRPSGRPLELGGYVLVRSVCREGSVPGAAIGVGIRIAHLRQSFVYALSAVGRRRAVDRGANQGMAEPDDRPDLQQSRSFGERKRVGLKAERSARAKDQRGVTQRLGGREQHEALRRFGQLADALEVVAFDVRRKLGGGRDLEATR